MGRPEETLLASAALSLGEETVKTHAATVPALKRGLASLELLE